jgi:hypothetical protein
LQAIVDDAPAATKSPRQAQDEAGAQQMSFSMGETMIKQGENATIIQHCAVFGM